MSELCEVNRVSFWVFKDKLRDIVLNERMVLVEALVL